MSNVRDVVASDSDPIMAIVGGSGAFDGDGIKHVGATLQQHLSGGSDAIWLVADDGEPVAVAYCAPEPVVPGVWNVLMLWTRPDRTGRGHGGALVSEIERRLRLGGARLLLVETSSLDAFAAARRFYEKCGFVSEARVRNFFAP